jgi:hypothetical protein
MPVIDECSKPRRIWRSWVGLGLACLLVATSSAQEQSPGSHGSALDQILDLYVRDGEVYYRALKGERAKLDGYVSRLATVSIDNASREERLAFWLNAYNAIVLQTVVDHYPIQKRTAEYPAKSIRQVPGAFERLPHRAAGKTVTLDQIEQIILPEFRDPRAYLALGRGAQGSGRLRSEAFTPEHLETQLTEAARECITRAQCLQVDRENDVVHVSSIFSWREKEFVAAYSNEAASTFASRSPIERAVLAMYEPRLLTIERESLAKNTFRMAYIPFDWTLNDLTGRGGR